MNTLTPWVVRKCKNSSPEKRLFCFAYAGGSASVFRQWEENLGDTEICAIQLPGRENRIKEPPVSDIEEITDLLLDNISCFFDIPYSFFGHSTGALLAYLLCTKIMENNIIQPENLFVSGSRPPHIPESNPINRLSDDEFIEELRKLSGTPDIILNNKELMKIYLPVLRADLALEEEYIHRFDKVLDVPITAFGGSSDDVTPVEQMEEWAKHTDNNFSLEIFYGDHFFINSKRTLLLKAINNILNGDEKIAAGFLKTVTL